MTTRTLQNLLKTPGKTDLGTHEVLAYETIIGRSCGRPPIIAYALLSELEELSVGQPA
ncbi:MAG: hypothetical protein ABSE77_11855 [Acidimicrobiales bacterium]|jgi:hypothetical protein